MPGGETMLVTIPEGLEAGETMQVQCPPIHKFDGNTVLRVLKERRCPALRPRTGGRGKRTIAEEEEKKEATKKVAQQEGKQGTDHFRRTPE